MLGAASDAGMYVAGGSRGPMAQTLRIFRGSVDSHQFPGESRSQAHITWPLQKLIVKEDFDFVSFWDGTGATVDGSQIRREQQLIV